MEYTIGHERIREPDRFLETGEVVDFHLHQEHHNTHLLKGLFELHRRLRIVDAAGNTIGWQALPVLKIAGGVPGSVVPVPADMLHKLVVLEGPAFYRCCFAHRDGEGKLSEIYLGYEDAYGKNTNVGYVFDEAFAGNV